MDPLEKLIDQRIRDAAAQGLFDGLPGAGKPLELDDLSGVPEELRAGYLLLRNAGVLPEEMELRKHILTLQDLLAACDDEEERGALRDQLRNASIRYELLIERQTRRKLPGAYRAAALGRLARRSG